MAWARLRLLITSVQGGGNYVTIGELQFRGTIGGATLCTGGTAFADSYYTSGTYGPLTADKAFDGTNAIANSWISNVTSLPHHVGYIFAAPVDIAEIAISWPPGYGANNEQPKGVSLQGSNDGGSTWTTIQSLTLATFTSGETKTLTVIPDITAAAAGTPRRPSGAVAARHAPPGFAAAAGMPRRPSGASAAHHAPPIAASAAGAPRRPSGSASARYAPPAFAAAAGAPRRPSGAARASHTFRPPPHLLRTSYTLTLTRSGLPDLLVPLATWQAVAQSEAATVLTCTAPYSTQLAADLADYTGATLRIDQHLHYTDRTLSGVVVSVPWDGAPRIDRGGRSQTVTLQGRQFPTGEAPPAKLVRLDGVQYVRTDDAGRSVRAAIDFFAAPGDTLDYGDGTIAPDRITYVCSPGLAWMEARG